MSNFTDFFEEYDRLRLEYRSTEDFLTFLGVENPATLACRLNAYKRNKLVPPPSVLQLFEAETKTVKDRRKAQKEAYRNLIKERCLLLGV